MLRTCLLMISTTAANPAICHILQIVQGGKVSQYTKLNCNSLENICGWTVVLHGQSLLHRLFHRKSFAVLINPRKLNNRSYLLIILMRGHTHTHTHTHTFPDKSDFKKPGAHWPFWFKKSNK